MIEIPTYEQLKALIEEEQKPVIEVLTHRILNALRQNLVATITLSPGEHGTVAETVVRAFREKGWSAKIDSDMREGTWIHVEKV